MVADGKLFIYMVNQCMFYLCSLVDRTVLDIGIYHFLPSQPKWRKLVIIDSVLWFFSHDTSINTWKIIESAVFADEPWITNIRLEHQSHPWPEKISLVIRPLKVAGAINSIAVGGIQLRSAKVLKDIFPRYSTTRWCFQNMCYTLNVWLKFLFKIESWYRHALWNQRDKRVTRYVDVEKLWRSRCVTCIATTMGRHAVNSNP